MVIHEPIVTIDDDARRVVWTAAVPFLKHNNASAQVLVNPDGGAIVVWIADLLPDEAAGEIGSLMDKGAAAMKSCLDRLAGGESN